MHRRLKDEDERSCCQSTAVSHQSIPGQYCISYHDLTKCFVSASSVYLLTAALGFAPTHEAIVSF